MLPVTIEQELEVALKCHQSGRLAEAERFYERILAREPDHADALNLMGLVAHQTGRKHLAAELIRKAVARKPTSAMYHQNLGLALSSQGRLDEAVAAFRRALLIQPAYAIACDNLGCALTSHGHFNEAVTAHRQALFIQPNFAWAYCHLGAALSFLGQFDEADACFQQAVQLAPENTRIHNDFLVFLHYNPRSTLSSLLSAHLEYDRRHAAPLRSLWRPHSNTLDSERPLRLGFLSPHFASHPVGRFLIRPLEYLDSRQFHVACYSDTPVADEMTARIKAASAAWHETSGLNDEELADRIRADEVDILFDLAGHTAGNRLQVFARRPAPLQITWLDYVGTTGLTAMDYILADPQQIPPGAEPFYREKVLRMPVDYICYDPPANAPPVEPLPALARGYVTFASFNILATTTPHIFGIWARILRRVPHARLRLKNLGLTEPATRTRLLRLFAEHGIAAERLELLGWSPAEEVLACYNQVDLALDTWPYNGGLTTCEALWMGVPVVTYPGEIFASRHGLAHLSAAGATGTIAKDLDHYVELAVALATDLSRLAALRARLRQQAAAASLCDGAGFAAHFAAVLRDVWRQWIRQTGA